MAKEKEIAEEYASSLSDLTVNSKPLINMLTILAEENVEHAGVIVETVEKHLEKVQPEIKLPVLYLVDSIIKNVGGAYTQKFSQSIVNMFTRTFKQVDEKTRSQMFKLRETWHDVFPATKLYQLDVKVNLIDPAWPIQAQPQQSSSIHSVPTTSTSVAPVVVPPRAVSEEERMRGILAKKEQELLMLQQKKIEMQLEHTRRQLEMAEKNAKKTTPIVPGVTAGPHVATMPVAMVNPVVAPPVLPQEMPAALPAKARLGPPVNKPSNRIAPVSAALASARRDPRLARMQPSTHPSQPPPIAPILPQPTPHIPQAVQIAPNVFDIKPLERTDRVIKRKNVITYDVQPADLPRRDPRKDPRVDKRREKARLRDERRKEVELERRKDVELERRKDVELERRKDVELERRKDVELERRKDVELERRKDVEERRKVIEERKKEIEERRKEIEERRKENEEKRKEVEERKEERERKREKLEENHKNKTEDENSVDKYMDKLLITDPKKINKLPPIPKINRDDKKDASSPVKRKKEIVRVEKKKKKDSDSKDSSSGSSPEKRQRNKEVNKKKKERRAEEEKEKEESEVVTFKELKNYHKEHYRGRNKEKSESPEPQKIEEDASKEQEPSNLTEVLENKDVDLRVLPVVDAKAAPVAQKRPSTETAEGKPKKNKLDKFDILFGHEDVDLRQLPQVEEVAPTVGSPKADPKDEDHRSPQRSPRKDWNEVKEKEEVKKTPSKLDLVRAKLAEATKGKDRLGRPLLFSKSPSIERERRRTLSSDDTDLRSENPEEFDADDHKKTISIIMNQAKEQYTDGQLDKNQYNTLMYQVLQLNEKLKLKEAKQRESLELSKRKLKAHIQEQNQKVSSPKSSPKTQNNFGDIDERVTPSVFLDTPPDSQSYMQDSDMRMKVMDNTDGPPRVIPMPPKMPPMFIYGNWRGPRPRGEEFRPIGDEFRPREDEFRSRGDEFRPRGDDFGPRRFRGPMQPPFFRPKFDKRGPRVPFEHRMPLALPTPQIGKCQGENPLRKYERVEEPPPLGAPGVVLPPTDYQILEFIDQDPVKTIQIDGIPREIRWYGDTAIIMLDWDDPREIKFLPGCRRVTFDNKDSVVLTFNEPYKQVEIDDQVFDIKFGAPTRELFINGRWWECFFGGQPLGVIIDGKPRLVHLEGPLPQVDIGKAKRTDLVAGKINLIVNATQMCPVYLDAKVQKFMIGGKFFTIRFVDALKTVLINEQPFKVEFGDLPKPITVGNEKYFIRFSALPRNVKPGYVNIANMEGATLPALLPPIVPASMGPILPTPMEVDQELQRPPKTPSPEGENQGLEMLASLMPSNMEIEAPPSATEYSSAEPPLFAKPEKIPGLESSPDEKPPTFPILGNIDVNNLFAKLVATGIVMMPNDTKPDAKDEKIQKEDSKKPKEDKTKIHRVDLLRPETLRVKQPGLVGKLYGGMQCSGCGARFPPEHTVRYSQHLDWHFRQNRRDRDSARRAHSRHWHYDLSDWVQYEEVEDLEEREKSWFETGGGAEGEAEGPIEAPEEAPSVAAGAPVDSHCALCGDKFDQFYNEDKEEWHLRNSVKYEENNYHPLCFEDYKASQMKEEVPQIIELDEVIPLDKEEESIVAIDADEINSQSDNESVVEVVETEKEPEPPLEIEEDPQSDGEEDDVVLKAEPVEQVTVEDDADTDDETTAAREERDKQAAIDFSKIKIKQEPIDPDDEPIITAEDEQIQTAQIDTTHATVLSSIDGNTQLAAPPAPQPSLPAGGIRINITKTIPTTANFITNICDDRGLEDISAEDEPLPPGEEPELQYTLKPGLEAVHFSRQPPVVKGNELSGLCSIM